MKRSAAVVGVLEIGQGVCKLKLKNLTFRSEAGIPIKHFYLAIPDLVIHYQSA